MNRAVCLALAVAAGCGGAGDASSARPRARGDLPPMLHEVELPAALVNQADGEDDNQTWEAGELDRIGPGQWQAIDRLPATALPIVCDLVPFQGALYVSHARDVINKGGARVHRWSPSEGWSLALDYDRGGQGFPRLRVIDRRVVAVDGDSTSAGFFGVSGDNVETYLFVSGEDGTFAPIGDRPPAGLRAAPFALHLFDAILYGGEVVTSGGTAHRDAATRSWPAGLWVGWNRPQLLLRWWLGSGHGVVRTTYMHRFKGRLYVGFQNNEHRARFDLAVIGGRPFPPAGPDPVLARVTPDGGWLTRRFASAGGVLYWVASGYRRDGRRGTLFRSRDGVRFEPVALPDGAGAVQDVVAQRELVFVLTTKGLFRSRHGGAFAKLADAPPGDPFGFFDQFCSAPLAAFDGALYAGATRDGRVFRLESR